MASGEKKRPRVRVSKNRKRNWNKYCDITEVEEYLEEKRFDERIGGAVSEKSDAELYFIHTDRKDKVGIRKKPKQLKCFQNIGSYSKVPPPHNRNIQPYSKKIKNVLTKGDEKRLKKIKTETSKENKGVENAVQMGDLFVAEIKDLWGEEAKVDPEIEDLVKFRDEYTRKRTPNVPGHRYQKPSLLPSVEVAHSGASYNPDFFEHQKLLNDALIIEKAKEKEELHLKTVLTDMFPTKAEAPTEKSILEEMSQGLFDKDDSDEEENKDENTFFTRNPPVSSEDRVTKSRKRKRKEMKEKERLKRLESLRKKNLNEVYRIRSIKSEIKQENETTQKRIERKLQRRIEKMYTPKTLSKHKYEAPDLEVHLADELCSSLRTLKTEGNVLEDRYKSLQRRNLIEPRIKQNRKRKYKLKVQVKRSHRNFK